MCPVLPADMGNTVALQGPKGEAGSPGIGERGLPVSTVAAGIDCEVVILLFLISPRECVAFSFTLGSYWPFFKIPAVLQQLQERKSDMLSKVYSHKKRSYLS